MQFPHIGKNIIIMIINVINDSAWHIMVLILLHSFRAILTCFSEAFKSEIDSNEKLLITCSDVTIGRQLLMYVPTYPLCTHCSVIDTCTLGGWKFRRIFFQNSKT